MSLTAYLKWLIPRPIWLFFLSCEETQWMSWFFIKNWNTHNLLNFVWFRLRWCISHLLTYLVLLISSVQICGKTCWLYRLSALWTRFGRVKDLTCGMSCFLILPGCIVELLMTFHLRATGRHLWCGITVLPATRHKWTHPARQTGTWFTYPRDQRVNHYTTPNCYLFICYLFL